ncbi:MULTISPECIES: SRPBCC family protein [Micromonospora]|uniref:Polyketide cyclase / dehydrase and lipid transport n=1 Tax=Micromonospora yangpuensis TaxID=683228 RepID=A0A1C6VG82_9ACTN|nr:SRPBCC family protein [Micromonospora yangpuensis]GGM32287.1 hypothetical protein GCM10012279_59020 [Micromonospora yangpuensis]SCL65311.1 Polyketide cyclase / dehydrase and lipid transport [Micromonospora yangpuensis]
MEHRTSVLTTAGPTELWRALTDPTEWPRWTASMTRVEALDGPVAPGNRFRIVQPGLRPMVWTVTGYVDGSSYEWTASLPGVTSVAWHAVGSAPDGRFRIELGIRQSGPLAPLVGLLVGRRTRRYVDAEAEGLVRYAEHAG